MLPRSEDATPMSALSTSDLSTSKPILLLLEHDFEDPSFAGQRFFCRHGLLLEGALSGIDGLRDRLEVRRVGFPRPRRDVIGLVGESDQSLPKLVLPSGVHSTHASGEHATRQYVSGSEPILATLAELYAIPQLHP
ncbi:hypothetical protein XcyCFBP4188_09755 [Xanthomonas hortorum pv. cynarae]|nr:hypothetical protein XcyCFBP4188_09755 [Xanthomonas hortorum pv. cynarae]